MKTLLKSLMICLTPAVVFSAAASAQQYGPYATTGYFQQDQSVAEPQADPASGGVVSDCGSGNAGCGVAYSGCGDSCRYFSLFGGWVNYYDTSFDFESTGQINGEGELELIDNDGWAIGSAIGRRINCHWRAEAEFAFRDNTLDSAQLSFGAPGAPRTFSEEDIQGRIRMYTSMLNVYRDFGGECSRIRPYVGAGAGVAFLDAEATTTALGGLTVGLDESAFAWQVMAGATLPLSCRADLFAEYRIVATDEEELSIASAGLGTTASVEFETMSNNVLFGIRIKR